LNYDLDLPLANRGCGYYYQVSFWWERRSWKREEKPIKNLVLVQQLVALDKEPGTLKSIESHAGARWIEHADSLATAGTRAKN